MYTQKKLACTRKSLKHDGDESESVWYVCFIYIGSVQGLHFFHSSSRHLCFSVRLLHFEKAYKPYNHTFSFFTAEASGSYSRPRLPRTPKPTGLREIHYNLQIVVAPAFSFW